MVRLLTFAAVLVAAAGPVQAEDQESRSRKVKVALALADAPKADAKAAPAPVAAVKLDWFGDSKPAAKVAANVPCICGNDCKCAAGTCPGACPVAGKAAPAPTYRVEKQCQQWYDARGYLHSQCVDVLVAVPAIGK